MSNRLIDIDDAVEIVMRQMNKTRRQARVFLVQAMGDGRLPATAINPDTGERERLPPEVWPKVQ
jgi:hypothetical protein